MQRCSAENEATIKQRHIHIHAKLKMRQHRKKGQQSNNVTVRLCNAEKQQLENVIDVSCNAKKNETAICQHYRGIRARLKMRQQLEYVTDVSVQH